ncbi:MAG: response regulator [Lachnospiraceae bacterium]|nr:response regulator [Lachnospiraceae bacterium]
MHKVLIVEDEILARFGLRQLINWEEHGFVLLPDAKDGNEAIKSILELQPDILLLDLNIPDVNGIQILEYLKEQHIQCKVIVVSCIEEFEIVKKALKLGAYNYLRKYNLSAEELLEILDCCKLELEADAEQEQKPDTYTAHDIRYEEIISHSIRDIFERAEEYHMLICILAQNQPIQDFIYLLSDCVCQWLKEWRQEYLRILKGSQCGYFLFENTLQESFFQKLLKRLKDNFGSEIYIGIYEGKIDNVEALNAAMARAEQITSVSYYDREAGIYYFKDKIPMAEYSPREIRQLLEELKTAVDDFDRERTENAVREIFKLIRKEPYIRINVLQRIFIEMLGIYSIAARTLNRAIEEVWIWNDNCHYQKLMMISSLIKMEAWFLEFSKLFYRNFLIEYKSSQSDILKQVFAYIDSHLYEQVQLSKAAKEIGVSGAYLSTVFKKEMGVNFIEHVNRRKVDMAKKMLEEGELVYEVSERLGYENSTYFSKVFKRYEGISPDAFRKKYTG